MRMEDFHEGESLLLFFWWAITDLLITGPVDDTGADLPTLSDLHNECYGIADRVCGQCQHDKKMCQDIVVEGESFCLSLVLLSC